MLPQVLLDNMAAQDVKSLHDLGYETEKQLGYFPSGCALARLLRLLIAGLETCGRGDSTAAR